MKSITGRQVLIFSLILGSLCISSQAQAADGTGVLNNIADRYQAQASAWQGAISAAATRLFWSLALISMVWTFGMMALRKADIQEMFAELVRYLMFTGFFFFLLSNASAIAKAIMNSLTQLASTASGLPPITPSGIMDVGFNVLATVLTKSSLWSPVDSALGIAVGLIILVVLALVAINMLILLVSGWILAYTAYLATDLARYGITPADVAAPGCYAYELASWRLRSHLRNDKGDLWTRAANYHSRTPAYNAAYRSQLMQRAAKWAVWLGARFPTFDVTSGNALKPSPYPAAVRPVLQVKTEPQAITLSTR